MQIINFIKFAGVCCICILSINTLAFTQSNHSFQAELGFASNSGMGGGPSIGFTYGIRLIDRLYLTANLNYSVHSRTGFVYAVSEDLISVVNKEFRNPVSNEPGLYKDGLIEMKPHDWVFSTIIFRPGISYDVLRSKKHELNFRLDGWITHGNLHWNVHTSHQNYFYRDGNLVTEEPIVVIVPIKTSAYGFGYGFRIEYLYSLNKNYSMGLSMGHGDSYSLVYSLNFLNILLKYKF